MKISFLFFGLLLGLITNSIYAQEISSAWLKKPMPGLKMTAAYMTIVNNTDKDLILEKVSGPDAKFYEIHTHAKIDGVMKMRKLESLTIKKGSKRVLKPMGDHIMLLQMNNNLDKKESTLTLHFSQKKPQTIKVPIKKN